MSLLGRFFPPPSFRIAALDTRNAARLAVIHAGGFARPWSTLEFERLLGERNVVADGLFVGQASAPAGFVLSRSVIDEAEILTVAIAGEARGRGYARPLLQAHLDFLSRAGIGHVHLEVEDGNAPALALYRRLGFGEIGRRNGYYGRADGTRPQPLPCGSIFEGPVARAVRLPYKRPLGAERQGAGSARQEIQTWRKIWQDETPEGPNRDGPTPSSARAASTAYA